MLPKSTDKVAARSGLAEGKPSNGLDASQMVYNHESTVMLPDLPN